MKRTALYVVWIFIVIVSGACTVNLSEGSVVLTPAENDGEIETRIDAGENTRLEEETSIEAQIGIGEKTSDEEKELNESVKIKLTVGNQVLEAVLAENTSAEALLDKLKEGPVTIDMRDYASMEKVGDFPWHLPRNDQQITTEAGDLILYQGKAFVIYYAPNSWNFTRIGKVEGLTGAELKSALGSGNVSVTLSIE